MVAPFAIPVHLTPTEVLNATNVGKARLATNLERGDYDSRGLSRENALTAHILGAAGELAVAKLANVYWNGDVGDFAATDAGPHDVRTSEWLTARLCLHPTDKPRRVYILVVGKPPGLWVVGWLYGFDAMVPRYWGNPTGNNRPEAFWIPQADLLPWPPPPNRFFEARRRQPERMIAA